MTIHVTKERIERSRYQLRRWFPPGRSCICPIALSIEADTGCAWISVGKTSVMFTKNFAMHKVTLPKSARDFIETFDRDPAAAMPLEFELEVNFA